MSDPRMSQLCELVADVMGVPSASITLHSSPDTVAGWDSVKQLSLAVALEERFAIELSPEEIEEMADVGSILALVDAAARRC